jgi:hypothetical protein
MFEEQKLSRLITDIYDTALDPALWSGVLASIAATMNAQAGALLSKDKSRKSVDATYHTGLDAHFERTYADTYGKLGPVATEDANARAIGFTAAGYAEGLAKTIPWLKSAAG